MRHMTSPRALTTAALAAALTIVPAASWAQPATTGSVAQAARTAAGTAVPGQTAATAKPGTLPRGFRGIELGMSKEEVDALLSADELFEYRGPEDVTLLPSPNQSLIEAAGLSFVKRAFFQFYEGKLWVIIVAMNPAKMDHYSIFTTLSQKYGPPALLDPRESRWEDESTRVALERPLTLRYLDLEVYQKLREGSAARESVEELERREFLGGL